MRPERLVFAIPAMHGLAAGARRQEDRCAETVAYVCRGMTCSEPVKSLASLVR